MSNNINNSDDKATCPVPKDSLIYKLFTRNRNKQIETPTELPCPCSCGGGKNEDETRPEHLKYDEDYETGLSKEAMVSSIPRLGKDTKPGDKWIYPSPDRFHKAMLRKGWKSQKEHIDTVVAIHNTVNEQCWKEILKYEKFHESKYNEPVDYEIVGPKLVVFRGRPNDLSPKARLMHYCFGYTKPFDRHDWIVDRNGKRVRYVIDYYEGDSSTGTGIYMDVRPALDDLEAVWDRIRMQFLRMREKE